MYLFETARLRFRPLMESDALSFDENFAADRIAANARHPIRDTVPYTLAICQAGADLPIGYIALVPRSGTDCDEPEIMLDWQLSGASENLCCHALDAFIRFIPPRFGITELTSRPDTDSARRIAAQIGFTPCDNLLRRECAWIPPKTPTLIGHGVRLVCKRLTPPDVMRGWAASVDYDIYAGKIRVGCCSLRLGYTEQLFYGGQISYTVFPLCRGHGYAAAASRLLFELAVSYGMPEVSICCVPENTASRRTAENAGFTFEGENPIPQNLGMYAENRSISRRYIRKAGE